MAFKIYGSGSNGLALVIAKQSEKDEFRDDLWLTQPVFRLGLPNAYERQATLRIALQGHSGAVPLNAEAVHAMRPEIHALLRERGIRAVIAVGKVAMNLVARRSGSEEGWAGSVIQADPQDGPWATIPITPPWRIDNQLVIMLMARFIRRAYNIAQGKPVFRWQPLHTEVSANTLAELEAILRRKRHIGVDIETAGIDVLKVPITCLGLGDAMSSVSVPWETYQAGALGIVEGLDAYGDLGRRIKECCLDILAGNQPKIFHNGAYDILGLDQRGYSVGGEIEDTILQHRVCYPERGHGLQFATVGEFPIEPWKKDFKGDRESGALAFIERPEHELRLYNAKDTAVESHLFEALNRRLYDVHNGHEIYAEYKELAAIASRMQKVGMRVDRARAQVLRVELTDKLAGLREEWAALKPTWQSKDGTADVVLGKTGANKGVKAYFLETLAAPVVAESDKGEPSVSASALIQYRHIGKGTTLEKAAQICFYYRKNAKLLTAFIEKLAEQDRVHTTFNVWGTKGARWSAKQPNLMQISKDKVELVEVPGEKPRKVQITPNIRDLFQADEGFVIVEADYSQLELREVAYFSDMLEVLDWLEQDRKSPGSCDPHTMHARMMFRDPKIQKSDKRRDLTKSLTYALFYNYYQGVDTIYNALKPTMPTLTLRYLQDVQKRFYAARPQLPRWQESIAKQGREQGYIEAPLSGRRLYQPGDNPDLNMWLSFPVQSTGGDVANGAIRRISKQLDWESGEHIKIQVHDALLVQCRVEAVDRVARILKTEMERPVQLYEKTVSFPVDVKVGPNWKTMQDLHL